MFALPSGMFAQMPHNIWQRLNMKEVSDMVDNSTGAFSESSFCLRHERTWSTYSSFE